MKDNLKNMLKSVDILSDSEILEGLTFFEPKFYKKGDILIESEKSMQLDGIR